MYIVVSRETNPSLKGRESRNGEREGKGVKERHVMYVYQISTRYVNILYCTNVLIY